jgi:NAD(P)-dependent dehydrogenase (short-subunit alcohol dehydrogenase family)
MRGASAPRFILHTQKFIAQLYCVCSTVFSNSITCTNRKWEENMSRTALVTGGTRGIGAAISVALKTAGYQVAASYAGNDQAAEAFTAETGITAYKWDVGDYEASAAGIARVEEDLGPIEIVVANAGITRDAPFHRMTPDQWNEVVATNLTGVFNTVHPIWPGMREREFGGRSGHREISGAGRRALWHHRQRHLPGLYRHRYGDGRAGAFSGSDHRTNPGRTVGRARRNRALRAVPGR